MIYGVVFSVGAPSLKVFSFGSHGLYDVTWLPTAAVFVRFDTDFAHFDCFFFCLQTLITSELVCFISLI